MLTIHILKLVLIYFSCFARKCGYKNMAHLQKLQYRVALHPWTLFAERDRVRMACSFKKNALTLYAEFLRIRSETVPVRSFYVPINFHDLQDRMFHTILLPLVCQIPPQ